MILIMIAALALQAATPAQSDAKTPPAKSSQTADKSKPADQDDPDKKVCRRQTPVGSTIEQRVCKTKAQWDAEAANAQTTANGALSNLGATTH
jgi:hypothetical protein